MCRYLKGAEREDIIYLKKLVQTRNEMYAVIETGGKQYRVEVGDTVEVERLPIGIGEQYRFPRVVLFSDGERVLVGKPYLNDVVVEGKVLREVKGDKIIVFKYKRRKGYHLKKGHRQKYYEIRIEAIRAKEDGDGS